MSTYHTPVMVSECLECLHLKPQGIYVDATAGGGGHSLAMLEACPSIRLFCFDQDEEARTQLAAKLPAEKAQVLGENFAQLRTQLAYHKIKGIDGILFDLGVSSHQLDTPERGFSFDRPAPLDMRMDTSRELTAAMLIAQQDVGGLCRIFREYGEENKAYAIAKAIKSSKKEVTTTAELSEIIDAVMGKGSKEALKCKVRIFQALRIAVNAELDSLQTALEDAINLLHPQGRIVVMSYHSLEDRMVKQSFALAARDCICDPSKIGCNCDHHRQLKLLTKTPLMASAEEVQANPRSRSAKLRAAEKVAAGSTAPKEKYKKSYPGKGEK